jgi:hypothetical protein
MIEDRKPATLQDEALIIRNCARMLRHSLEWEMEATDTSLPHLISWEGPALTACPPGPNMDSPYLLARLDPNRTYRLSGKTDGLFDINVQVRPEFPPFSFDVVGDLGFRDLEIVDGSWELHMGPKNVPGKKTLILPSGPLPHLFFRSYWIDWSHTTRPVVELECLDSPPRESQRYTPELLGEQLRRAASYLDFREKFQHEWFVGFMKEAAAGGRKTSGGPTYLRYGGEHYDLGPSEALLVEFEAPDARLWNIHLYDAAVYDSFDWFRHANTRNQTQCFLPSEGKIQIVVSSTDPGIQNWLDTGGNPRGIVFFRWIWSNDSPPVSMRKMTIDEITQALHASTPPYTGEQRVAELKRRQRKLAHHFFW